MSRTPRGHRVCGVLHGKFIKTAKKFALCVFKGEHIPVFTRPLDTAGVILGVRVAVI